jgi:hypothetical protein
MEVFGDSDIKLTTETCLWFGKGELMFLHCIYGEGGGGQKNQFSPSPSSPPPPAKELVRRAGAREGEIFWGFFSNVRDKFSDFNV